MGTIRHHAIVVTFLDFGDTGKHVRNVHSWAKVGTPTLLITEILEGRNGMCSFAVLPDGSKDGWARSDDCDRLRDSLLKQLGEDPCISWVEIEFGEGSRPEISRISKSEEREEE